MLRSHVDCQGQEEQLQHRLSLSRAREGIPSRLSATMEPNHRPTRFRFPGAANRAGPTRTRPVLEKSGGANRMGPIPGPALYNAREIFAFLEFEPVYQALEEIGITQRW